MSAYVIVTEKVTDQKVFDQYRGGVVDTLAPFKGRFVVRGGKFSVVEGEWPMPRLVIIEFPSREAANSWYRSPAYQSLVPLRHMSSVGNMVIVDGP